MEKLATWLRHTGCCSIRGDLVAPGVLAKALLKKVGDSALREAIEPFADMESVLRPGESAQVDEVVARASRRLLHTKGFINMDVKSQYNWLVSQSMGQVTVRPDALAAELVRLGYVSLQSEFDYALAEEEVKCAQADKMTTSCETGCMV